MSETQVAVVSYAVGVAFIFPSKDGVLACLDSRWQSLTALHVYPSLTCVFDLFTGAVGPFIILHTKTPDSSVIFKSPRPKKKQHITGEKKKKKKKKVEGKKKKDSRCANVENLYNAYCFYGTRKLKRRKSCGCRSTIGPAFIKLHFENLCFTCKLSCSVLFGSDLVIYEY